MQSLLMVRCSLLYKRTTQRPHGSWSKVFAHTPKILELSTHMPTWYSRFAKSSTIFTNFILSPIAWCYRTELGNLLILPLQVNLSWNRTNLAHTWIIPLVYAKRSWFGSESKAFSTVGSSTSSCLTRTVKSCPRPPKVINSSWISRNISDANLSPSHPYIWH